MKFNHKAFSLVELSIVLIIIALLAVFVNNSNNLISSYRLRVAERYTMNSPVASMPNLVLWFEPTSQASLNNFETINGSEVSNWRDINPTSDTKYNVVQFANNRPTYIKNCINSLPCLRFDGVDDYFSYDGKFLTNSDYTVIVVEKRRSDRDENYFLAGNSGSTNGNLYLGYRANSVATFAQYNNDFDVAVEPYVEPVARIHVFTYSSKSDDPKTYFLNGVFLNLTGGNSAEAATGLSSYPASSIGNYKNAAYYDGDIAEIIMFDRALKSDERRAIESYLCQKWAIAI